MNHLEYSALVRKKMRVLKQRLIKEFGENTALKVIDGILSDAEILINHEESGTNISRMYDIDTEYWYLFTHHHYLIYRIGSREVIIVQMFHEKEDFMMKLFGISGRTQESIDYWGE